jgi:hypothetical protein
MFITGVNDTGDKLFSSVNNTGAVDTGDNIFPVVVDPCQK